MPSTAKVLMTLTAMTVWTIVPVGLWYTGCVSQPLRHHFFLAKEVEVARHVIVECQEAGEDAVDEQIGQLLKRTDDRLGTGGLNDPDCTMPMK
ncbi:hypothetical protein [Sinorhizobium fredii]|uniref:hypothetical protein n=1 Tax=Rhizobium fredii TaxID=380 RepID=UPI000CF23B58|nr:hypothetical protein [Sinorhizobium fredii]